MPKDERGFWMSMKAVLKTAFGTDERMRRETPTDRAAAAIDRLQSVLAEEEAAVPAKTVDEAIRQLVGDRNA